MGGLRISGAPLEIVSNAQPQSVFGGDVRRIEVIIRNSGTEPVNAAGQLRICQASSATAAPVGAGFWNQVQVLPGQTILDAVDVRVPAVKAQTDFVLEWILDSREVIGRSRLVVYPTNLLLELQTLAGATPFGLLDPAGRIRTVLEAQGIRFEDLGNRSLESFPGCLAIIAPLPIAEQRGTGLTDRIRKLAAKGVAVVWIVPPEDQGDSLMPSFYRVPVEKGNVIVAQAGLVADLADNPVSHLNLIRLAELALKPKPLDLPEASQKGE